MAKIRFGPAGNSRSFTEMGYKKNTDLPEYLEKMGLDAFEYQCGRGVKISEANCRQLGELCAAKDIQLSLHAPYYISMSSVEEGNNQQAYRRRSESGKSKARFDLLECNEELLKLH